MKLGTLLYHQDLECGAESLGSYSWNIFWMSDIAGGGGRWGTLSFTVQLYSVTWSNDCGPLRLRTRSIGIRTCHFLILKGQAAHVLQCHLVENSHFVDQSTAASVSARCHLFIRVVISSSSLWYVHNVFIIGIAVVWTLPTQTLAAVDFQNTIASVTSRCIIYVCIYIYTLRMAVLCVWIRLCVYILKMAVLCVCGYGLEMCIESLLWIFERLLWNQLHVWIVYWKMVYIHVSYANSANVNICFHTCMQCKNVHGMIYAFIVSHIPRWNNGMVPPELLC